MKSNAPKQFFRLEDLPNIGSHIANDLRAIGITSPADLRRRVPLTVFNDLKETMGRMTRQAFQHYAALAHLTPDRRRETALAGARMLEQIIARDAAAASATAWAIVEASHAAVREALGTHTP